MIRNYIKIAFRNLWKNKTYTAINIIGLSVAFGSSILLYLTSAFELSFDNFHKDSDRIFRLYFSSKQKDGTSNISGTMAYPLTPALKADFPELEGVTRINWGANSVVYKDKKFDKMIRSADADFLKMFSFPLLKGNVNTSLSALNNIVISKNMADDIFGKEEPMGKQLMLDIAGKLSPFIVTGVMDDFPENSSIEYDAYIRTETFPEYERMKNEWNSQNHEVFVKLPPNVSQAAFEKRLEPFLQKYMKANFDAAKKEGQPKNELGQYFSLLLTPLNDIHFDTATVSGQGTSKAYVYTLLTIAGLILLIASINFINLTVATSLTRAKEVGVRKSLGANKSQLFLQNWGEAFLVCSVALIIGLGLAYASLPQFNKMFRSHLSINNFLVLSNLIILAVGFLLVTFIAGGYPAMVASRFNIVEVLKGKLTMKKPGFLRNSLITTQFTIACLLISCTIVVFQQLKYLRTKPLGYNKEQVISVPINGAMQGSIAVEKMRNELLKYPSIVSISGSRINIGRGLDGSSSKSMSGFNYYPNANNLDDSREILTHWVFVEYDFLKTMDIKPLQGRDFSKQFGTDSTAIVVTESFAKQMGEKNAVDKFIMPDSSVGRIKIIGVVPDFNLYSLHEKREAITLQLTRKMRGVTYILVRVNPQNMSASMDLVKKTWKEIAPETEFQGSFIDENVNRWYKKEERLSQIFTTAAGIAILLSCMGLFAIALIVIEQRTKEIGVRKVLGASIPNIVTLISKDFLKLVLVAFVIATPIGYYLMSKWLEDFAYKTDLSWWIFALAGIASLVIALITVSYQSIKAALMNPVKSLKTE
ncbi:ABC transporter permease [Emticicia sp. SJ17W-69]|uniref:ABC transporter permease n=1 Tax=Emticicia sp. SJ17W-69 TaxID=3421657 RepID=UPI003EB7DB92